MGAVAVALLAIVLGSAIAYFGFGPDWIAWRLGSVLVLGGVVVASEPVADKLRQWAEKGADVSGDLVGNASRDLGNALSQAIIPAIVIIVGLLWVAAWLPSGWTRWLGRVVGREMDQKLLLGGAFAIGILGTFAGGAIGDLFDWISGTATTLGTDGVRWLGVA